MNKGAPDKPVGKFKIYRPSATSKGKDDVITTGAL